MKAIKILVFLIAIALGNTAHASSNHVQYDSLRIKISQMLIFGIQDVQKVMEADSMLEAFKSGILISAISRTCCFVTDPTLIWS